VLDMHRADKPLMLTNVAINGVVHIVLMSKNRKRRTRRTWCDEFFSTISEHAVFYGRFTDEPVQCVMCLAMEEPCPT
jgi:hypothetical protein